MNTVKSFGFLYVILRDIGKNKDPIVSKGFMRQTGYPWKSGNGIQIRIGKYIVQFGFCKSNKLINNESEGLLHAMQGRLLDEGPATIGDWK